jgi:hypothetical protein
MQSTGRPPDFSSSSYPEQDKTGSLGYFANRESTADRQQLREAELVPVRIGYVKGHPLCSGWAA